MGGEGQSVQADETYYGNTSKRAKGYKKGHRIRLALSLLSNPRAAFAPSTLRSATA